MSLLSSFAVQYDALAMSMKRVRYDLSRFLKKVMSQHPVLTDILLNMTKAAPNSVSDNKYAK